MPIPGIIAVTQYSSTFPTNLPSPAIWGNCPCEDLNDEGKGYYIRNSFEIGTIGTFHSTGDTSASTHMDSTTQWSTTALPTGNDHVLDLYTGSTSITAGRVSLQTQPLGPIVPGGKGIWFEACVGPINIPATPSTGGSTTAFFIGLATSTGLYSGVLSTVTSTASTNTLKSTCGYVGFWMHGDQTDTNCDAVYANVGSLTPSTVLANVLTASTANPNPGNLNASPSASLGAFTSTQQQKLGVLYQPSNNTLNWYVNGYVVASAQVNSSNFDVTDSFGAKVEIGGSTVGFAIDFLAVASQLVL